MKRNYLIRLVVLKRPGFRSQKYAMPRVARSTFCQGAKSSPERAKKESNSKTRDQKKVQLFFPNLSTVMKSYEPILRNLLDGNVPQSQL